MKPLVEKPQPDLELSNTSKLINLYKSSETPKRPKEISKKNWQIICLATEFIHQLELSALDELITQSIVSIIRAEKCGCHQCRKASQRISSELDKELQRQTIYHYQELEEEEYLPPYLEEQLKKGKRWIKRLKRIGSDENKQRRQAVEKRSIRLKQLMNKYMNEKGSHISDPLSLEERAEVKMLIQEAKQRAEANKKRRLERED